jgi:hypothetical protein
VEPSAPDRIPPPAWAGRPPLLRVLGERYVEAATLGLAGLATSAAAVALAPDRLAASMTIAAVVLTVGAVAAPIEIADLRKTAAEAPVADEGPSRPVDRGDYMVAAPWHWLGAVVAFLGSTISSGEVEVIGHPVLVGAAGLLVGLGIAACAGGRWVRRWERREGLTLFTREIPDKRDASPDVAAGPRRPPTPEEAARVQRKMMSGQGLDEKERAILARFAAEGGEKTPRGAARPRRYVVVPHPGRAATGRPSEPAVEEGSASGMPARGQHVQLQARDALR